MRKHIHILLAIFSNSLLAQVSDIELEVIAEGQDSVIPFLWRDYSVTITNNGPDDDPGPFAGTPPFGVSLNGDPLPFVFSFIPNQTSPCSFVFIAVSPLPGSTVGGLALNVIFPPIAAGESVTCTGSYSSTIGVGTDTFRWFSFPGFGVTDPNFDNNTVILEFINKPEIVYTLNTPSSVGLIILLLFAALIMPAKFKNSELK